MTRQTAYALMGAFGAIIFACAAVLLVRGGEHVMDHPQPSASAAIDIDAGVRFDLRKVLGRNPSEVEAVLGKGERLDDGAFIYDLGADRTAVTVMFDRDVAARVTIQPPAFRWSDRSVAEVLRSAGVDRRDVDLNDDPSYEHTLVEVWAPKMRERQERRRDKALALSRAFNGYGHPEFSAVAEGVDFEIRAPEGHCSRKSIEALLSDTRPSMIDDGFVMVECSGATPPIIVELR